MSDNKLSPAKTDPSAPALLVIETPWGNVLAPAKLFSTGSCGFYGNAKLVNPASGEIYQVGVTLTLVGSKPAVKAA